MPAYRKRALWLICIALAVLMGFLAGRVRAETGIASTFDDRRAACPPFRFHPTRLQVAHRSLPCGALVEITNLENGRRVVAEVADRGPFRHGRIVDLKPRAWLALGVPRESLTRVSIRRLTPSSGYSRSAEALPPRF